MCFLLKKIIAADEFFDFFCSMFNAWAVKTS